jgi:hypothetical protein
MYGSTQSNGFEFVKICPQIFLNLVNFITESEIYNGLGKDTLKHAKNFIIQATDITITLSTFIHVNTLF